MKDYLKKINKYIILLIISSLFGVPWIYFQLFVFRNFGIDSISDYIPNIVDYLVRLIVTILLIIDFKKENLKNIVLTCIASLLVPLFGVVIFSMQLLFKNKEKASA